VDAAANLNDLDSEKILDRLDALDRESEALRVLLRAARAKERRRAKSGTDRAGSSREDAHAR
jgi:hypothetical protein